MIPISSKIVASSIIKFQTDIDSFTKEAHTKLVSLKKREKTKLNPAEKKYLSNLISDISSIIIAPPKSLLAFQKKYSIVPKRNLKKKKGRKPKTFKDKIIDALGYNKLRSNFYPEYFQAIGIKSCVYCNAQLAVSVDSLNPKKRKTTKAKFQVDHYIAKSEFPCLSISLFNLYPVCASCNNSKSAKKIKFSLYSNASIISGSSFQFVLDPFSKAKFLLNRNSKDIKVTFKQPKKSKGYDDYNKTFDIQGVYDTQKDLVEELIIKAEIYTPSYRKALEDSFPKILSNKNLTYRIIIGNYSDVNEIHKRPMAKFTQDIAKQLGLI
jgi:hypothetical protein